MSRVADRLAELGLSLPAVAAPVAAYVPAVRSGNQVITSGQLPFVNGQLDALGKVGADVSIEDAQAAAAVCALNAIAAVGSVVDLDDIVRIVRLGVFVASDPDFHGQPQVGNGARELIGKVFGEAGAHARAAVGVTVLPLNACVEVELVAEVR